MQLNNDTVSCRLVMRTIKISNLYDTFSKSKVLTKLLMVITMAQNHMSAERAGHHRLRQRWRLPSSCILNKTRIVFVDSLSLVPRQK